MFNLFLAVEDEFICLKAYSCGGTKMEAIKEWCQRLCALRCAMTRIKEVDPYKSTFAPLYRALRSNGKSRCNFEHTVVIRIKNDTKHEIGVKTRGVLKMRFF